METPVAGKLGGIHFITNWILVSCHFMSQFLAQQFFMTPPLLLLCLKSLLSLRAKNIENDLVLTLCLNMRQMLFNCVKLWRRPVWSEKCVGTFLMNWVLCQIFPKKLVSFSTWIDHTRWARNTWAMAAIIILTMADIIDMVSMSFYHKSLSV